MTMNLPNGYMGFNSLTSLNGADPMTGLGGNNLMSMNSGIGLNFASGMGGIDMYGSGMPCMNMMGTMPGMYGMNGMNMNGLDYYNNLSANNTNYYNYLGQNAQNNMNYNNNINALQNQNASYQVDIEEKCANLVQMLKSGNTEGFSKGYNELVNSFKNSPQYSKVPDATIKSMVNRVFSNISQGKDIRDLINENAPGSFGAKFKDLMSGGYTNNSLSKADLLEQVCGIDKSDSEKLFEKLGNIWN